MPTRKASNSPLALAALVALAVQAGCRSGGDAAPTPPAAPGGAATLPSTASTEVYGTGAFLLAGSELYRMSKGR